jgi:hypothetical protein
MTWPQAFAIVGVAFVFALMIWVVANMDKSETMKPSDMEVAEKVADAVRTRDYEWFEALGYVGKPSEATLKRIVAKSPKAAKEG